MTLEPKFLIRVSLSTLRALAPDTLAKWLVDDAELRRPVELMVKADGGYELVEDKEVDGQ
jgi:hypothetical protein